MSKLVGAAAAILVLLGAPSLASISWTPPSPAVEHDVLLEELAAGLSAPGPDPGAFVPREAPPSAASAPGPENAPRGIKPGAAHLRHAFRRCISQNALGMEAAGTAERAGCTYPGKYYDREANLFYFNARYYDPDTGRFISQDGFDYGDTSNPPSLHLYYYALNNPLRYVDPDGRDPYSSEYQFRAFMADPFGALSRGAWGTVAQGVHAAARAERSIPSMMPPVAGDASRAFSKVESAGQDYGVVSLERAAIGVAHEKLESAVNAVTFDSLTFLNQRVEESGEFGLAEAGGALSQTADERGVSLSLMYRAATENLSPEESIALGQQMGENYTGLALLALPAARSGAVALEGRGAAPKWMMKGADFVKAMEAAGQVFYESFLKYDESVLRSGFGPIAKSKSVSVKAKEIGSPGVPRQGIYEFTEKVPDLPYTGQSVNVPRRVATHIRHGRVDPDAAVTVTGVGGGKTAREIVEHQVIQSKTGGVPAKDSPGVSNKVDPIGPNRRHLLEED